MLSGLGSVCLGGRTDALKNKERKNAQGTTTAFKKVACLNVTLVAEIHHETRAEAGVLASVIAELDPAMHLSEE